MKRGEFVGMGIAAGPVNVGFQGGNGSCGAMLLGSGREHAKQQDGANPRPQRWDHHRRNPLMFSRTSLQR